MTQLAPAAVGMAIDEIETPALIVDLAAYERNLARMAERLAGTDVRLRPHAKTPKSPIIGLDQVAHGAIGVCCQKVGEAEVMVEGGVRDVMVSNQVVGSRKIARLAALADEYRTGVHIHVAEDPCDEADARSNRATMLIDRLAQHGVVRPESIFAHGTHLTPDAIGVVNAASLTLAHNPRSNMNNAVGYAPIAQYRCPVMLGTDGIGQDMFAEAQQAWYIARDVQADLAPERIVGMLAVAARRASEALDITLGQLKAGAAADIILTDYAPTTPLATENFSGHLIFGLGSRHVRDVIAAGRWAMRDHKVLTIDEPLVRREATRIAENLWRRMEQY
ncbi:MAG: amidohydrolase family protein [Planctomycetes bacterium]|nr:amidohydrolase family protein [Planctomycetota bacterium]